MVSLLATTGSWDVYDDAVKIGLSALIGGLFAWLLARPVVASVIAGATKPEQVAANAAAAEWRLSVADLSEIDAVIAASKGV